MENLERKVSNDDYQKSKFMEYQWDKVSWESYLACLLIFFISKRLSILSWYVDFEVFLSASSSPLIVIYTK